MAEDRALQLWSQFRQSRDPGLRGRLIERYLPLARAAAARLFRVRADSSIPFADYLQYARLGLVEAIDGYDPTREASFETYSSYRIRGAMLNGLGHETEFIAQRTFWRAHLADRLASLKPAPQSTGDDELEALARMTVSLAIGFLLESEETEVEDETPRANPYASAELSQLREIVRASVTRLPPREQQLIRRHYFEHCEFREIAREMTVTPGRVSQLHSQALERIRNLLKQTPGFDRSL